MHHKNYIKRAEFWWRFSVFCWIAMVIAFLIHLGG